MIKTIQRLMERFLAEGPISNQNSGKKWLKQILQSGGLRKVAEHVGQAPKVSVRRLAIRVELNRSSTYRILKEDLKLSAFKFQACQKLSAADSKQREEFCKWFLQQCNNSPSFLSSV